MAKVREKVMNQCKVAFEIIKKANGYNTDVMTISRIPKEYFGLVEPQFPALFVSDLGVEVPVDQSDPAAIVHRVQIEIQGHFRDRSPEISSNFNAFYADIKKVIYAPIVFEDPPGTKYADHVLFIGMEVQSESPPDILFRVQFTLDYWFNKAAP